MLIIPGGLPYPLFPYSPYLENRNCAFRFSRDFWATHAGAELDLFLLKDGRRLGVECKRVDAPRLTPSMRTALDDLQLERLIVLYPNDRFTEQATNHKSDQGQMGLHKLLRQYPIRFTLTTPR